MSESTAREQFETWVSKKYPNESLAKCRADQGFIYCVDDYVVPAVQVAWLSWQASREAIELDLPEPFDKHQSGEGMYYADEVDKIVEAAGLRIKQ